MSKLALEMLDLKIVEEAEQRYKEALAEAAENYQKHLDEEEAIEMGTMIQNREKIKESYLSGPTKVKKALFSTVLDTLYESVLSHLNINDGGIRYNYINGFMESDCSNINMFLDKIEKLSEFWAETVYTINKHTAAVLEACKEKCKDGELVIDLNDELKSSFMADFDQYDIDSIGEKIADRVQQSQLDFIDANQRDKEMIENIIAQTQEKVNTTVKEELIDLYNSDCNRAIRQVEHGRSKNILECMINSICKKSYNNNLIKEQFLTENSKLDMDKVMQTASIMDAFLEMTISLKLAPNTEEYMQTVYEQLTK